MGEKYQIVWSEAAIRDMDRLITFIAERGDVQNARKLQARILSKIDKLARYPLRCRVVPELRELGVSEFRELITKPYRICFRVHDRDIVLVGILDGRRELGELLIERAMDCK